MLRVVQSTRKLNTNVQIGSIKLHSGWKLRKFEDKVNQSQRNVFPTWVRWWGNFEHLEVDDNGSKEDADGLDEVAEHVNEGRGDIDVFTWSVYIINIEMTNYDWNCDDEWGNNVANRLRVMLITVMTRSLTVLFRFEAFLDVVRVAVVRSTTMAEDDQIDNFNEDFDQYWYWEW